jgi:hypothetical protein
MTKVKYILSEKWKELEYRDIKPMYLISNHGRILNKFTNKFISLCEREKGYPTCCLQILSNKSKTFKLHRIVAFNFLDYIIEIKIDPWTVNHMDGDKIDCSEFNLEWLPFSENIRHSFALGLNKGLKGEDNGSTKYPEIVIHVICELLELGYVNKEIKKIILLEYGYMINDYLVYDIREKRRWVHVSAQYNI